MKTTLSQAETAAFISLSYSGFLRHKSQLILKDGFPMPYIGDPFNAGEGPRCRWTRADVMAWQDRTPKALQPEKSSPMSAANDIIDTAPIAQIDNQLGALRKRMGLTAPTPPD